MNPNNKASTSTFENSNLDGSALEEDKNGSDSDSSDAEELIVEAEVTYSSERANYHCV